jgi:transposase
VVNRELKRKHVTRMLLWQEYREAEPEGLEYSQFCDRYRDWAKCLPVTMRQQHRAGEKLFVDFSGDGIEIVDRRPGEVVVAKLFVAVLGASNYTYVEPVCARICRRGSAATCGRLPTSAACPRSSSRTISRAG